MDEEASQSQRDRQALRELTRLLGRSDQSFESTIEDVLALGCRYLGVDIGFLAAIDEDRDHFEVRHARGDHPDLQPGTSCSLDVTYCRRTIDADDLYVLDDATADHWQDDPAAERFELACYLGGAITIGDDLFGTLCFADMDRRDQPFSPSEIAFVELIVEWVGNEIEHHQQEDELAFEEQFVDTVFDALEDAVFVVDTGGHLTRWNSQVNAITELDDEALSGIDVRELLVDSEIERFEQKLTEVIETGDTTLESEVVSASGERVPLEFRASLMTGPDGTIIGICGVGRDITERREREQRLEQYERAMENVRGMVYVLDDDGYITLVTPGLSDRLDYDSETLVGTHIGEIVSDTAVATERREGTIEDIAETNLIAAGGREIPVRIDVTPLDGGVVGAVRDVTELTAARRELDDERSRFRYLFDTIPDPVGEVRFEDGEPILRDVNAAFEEMFGYEAPELVGRSTNDIIVPPDVRDEAHAIDETVLREGAMTVEIRRETENGLRDFLFRGIPYNEGGEEVRGFGIYTDITDQKRRERYLQILARIVRHNLRNKLDVIIGNAEWLAQDLDEEQTHSTDLIISAAENLEELSATAQQIERLLDKSPSGDTTTDVTEILERVRHSAALSCPNLSISIEAPASLQVHADERLQLAIEELIDNAVEHGGESVALQITVNASGDSGWATVAVADDGPGIPETERWVLTGESEITQLNHSRGLGLWLVKWIVESFGGDLRITTSDAGSVVTIQLREADEQPDPL